MKHSHSLLAGLLMLAPTVSALAATPVATGCEAKRQDIEQQLRYARAQGNDHRTAGLEKALSEVNAHCTDSGLRAEREADVREKARKVTAREQELAEARADGRADKIRKKERKLDEARAELEAARAALTQ
ncbi:DUF1090 domain-containing protein [Enterobacter ludwigii]|jgi:hypothetical protein|uniref:DUF1090 domain-containing protein n=1 Tax=Enterobacter TaxID=547 RepID=UPI001639A7EB|nr:MULTISPECIES: DUF1090 domain-containing protein [Enterobacter]EKS6740479.1 DUF1090 domain-containing protein [Enterobacter ludwigii]MBK1520822.1 DUF1090 domain-containing protein [Enterobacter ludwigii]MDR6368716.1 multidrug efflux pump subunit AcrA (membrane-fusion protein) [Enterobacter sp. SORGH_AS_0287]